jgi:hypothetical protein
MHRVARGPLSPVALRSQLNEPVSLPHDVRSDSPSLGLAAVQQLLAHVSAAYETSFHARLTHRARHGGHDPVCGHTSVDSSGGWLHTTTGDSILYDNNCWPTLAVIYAGLDALQDRATIQIGRSSD